MIRYVPHREIDQQQWDTLLGQCPNRIWYAQSWVLNIASPGWDALIDVEAGAIMPITHRSKHGFKYLYQPFALQQLGVFSLGAVNGEMLQQFLAAIPRKFRYIDIYLNNTEQFTSDAFTFEVCTDQQLDLRPGYEQLLAAYSTGVRRNLKRTAGLDKDLSEQCGPEQFVELYSTTTGDRYGGSSRRDMDLLQLLLSKGIERDQVSIHAINRKGSLLAAVVFVQWEGRAILLKSANNDRGRELRTMFFLVDRSIRLHAGKPLVLDFAGSMTPSVARFNSSFGAEPCLYLRLLANRLPPILKAFKK